MTLRIEENIAGLKIPVDQFTRVHVLECLYELVYDEFFMNFFKDAGSDHDMKV